MRRVYHPAVAAMVKSLAFVSNHAGAKKNMRRAFSRVAMAFDCQLRRAICVLLVTSLLAVSTPAAP